MGYGYSDAAFSSAYKEFISAKMQDGTYDRIQRENETWAKTFVETIFRYGAGC